MDLTSITQLISSVGFPIVACIALFVYMYKEREAHKQEMEKMTEALNNNTIALTRIETKLSEVNK